MAVCKKCGKIFKKNVHNQQFCGSKKDRIGCSWENCKNYLKEYDKEWKKNQRKLNTNYAIKQREIKKRYYQTEHGKIIKKNSCIRNIKNKLYNNRKRMLLKKGILGTHTEIEWNKLKEEYNNKCLSCGITEEELKEKWKNTSFNKLTKDHIIPISRGGTDYIWNIQPLCISCNCKKRDKLGKIITVSGGMDCLHIGHVRLFEQAKKFGDTLIVILNNDNWLMAKKGYVFMPQEQRAEIIMALRAVDGVVITNHPKNPTDMSVSNELKIIRPNAFLNGGDRKSDNTPEDKICKELGIEMVFNVGGEKIQSSSWLINKAKK